MIRADETVTQVLKEDSKPTTSKSGMWLHGLLGNGWCHRETQQGSRGLPVLYEDVFFGEEVHVRRRQERKVYHRNVVLPL